MAFPMPLAIPKSRTINIGGGAISGTRITKEMQVQSEADLHSMLVGITREDTQQQIGLGNPPQIAEVDDRTGKPVDQAERKVVVLFGNVLARSAMCAWSRPSCAKAISRSTTTRTGRLMNIGASWEWRYIPKGGTARVVTSANPPTTLAAGDKIVLVPVNVPYATAVNRSVLGRAGMKGRTRSGGSNMKATRESGFLAATTRAV